MSRPPPDTMPAPSSWRSLASGASSRVRAYINGAPSSSRVQLASPDSQTPKQTWEQWARQKLSRRSIDDLNGQQLGVEQVVLFPGWASRNYVKQNDSENTVDQFTLDVSVSGYATSLRPPELASRSQRAFMRIARGFAALPKLPTMSASAPPSPTLRPSRSSTTDSELLDLSQLPPGSKRLDDTTLPLAAMTEEPEELFDERDYRSSRTAPSSRSSTPEPPSPSSESISSLLPIFNPDDIALLHVNLNARLRPFWASPVANRLVRLRLYMHPPVEGEEEEPLMTQDTVTTPQGAFTVRFRVPFERLCTHPRGLHVAFGERDAHHIVRLHAHLLPPPPRQIPGEKPLPPVPVPQVEAEIVVPLTHARVRVISDVDDTVKMSEILRGARAAFRNVFVRPLDQVVVPSMSSWYSSLYSRGVRFHYVSNSPFELLAVLMDFFNVAGLPPGSLKLKFYGGRSLFHGLWEPAGERKRQGVVEILDAFPDARFFLVGDTGEQDLELYATLARERPRQILGVFVRDVSTLPGPPLADPAPRPAQRVEMHAFNSTGDVRTQPAPSPSMSMSMSAGRAPRKAMTDPPQMPAGLASAPGSRPPSPTLPGGTPTEYLTPLEKRRLELQARVERARDLVPRHIPVRVFREPSECVEAGEIMDAIEKEGSL